MNKLQAKHIVITRELHNNTIAVWNYLKGAKMNEVYPERFYDGEGTPERRRAWFDEMAWAKEQTEKARALYNPIDDAKVGDGITLHGYSDAEAHTIIKRTATTITLQRDDAEHVNKKDLAFHVGGFSAHCSNQNGQEWVYTQNTENGTTTIRRRADGQYKTAGQNSGAKRASLGRHEFYDFNF